MLKIKLQGKKNVNRPGGHQAMRVSHVQHGTGSKRSAPCYRIRCGCCNETLDIFYPESGDDALGLEINGVLASLGDWREILLPILRIEKNDAVGGGFIDVSDSATEAREILARLRKDYAKTP